MRSIKRKLDMLEGAAEGEFASEARSRPPLPEAGYRWHHARAFARRVEVAADAIWIKRTGVGC